MKLSTFVCALAWTSAFLLAWGWLLGVIEPAPLSYWMFLFFIMVGLGAGIQSIPRKG